MPPLTRPWKDTLREQIQESSEFRRALLREIVICLFSGDPGEVDTGKNILGDLIDGTVGFLALGQSLGCSPEILKEYLTPSGDPSLKLFLAIVAYLQKQEGAEFKIVDHAA